MKLYLPPHVLVGRTMQARLQDQQANQAAKRVGELVPTFDVKELRALKFLAYELFGRAGLVQFTPEKRGIAQLGKRVYFTGPQGQRLFKIVIVFEGATIEEISRQVKTWKEKRA